MYPKYVEVDGEKYEINTDFRVAIRCNEVALKDDIGDLERGLAIIYLLYGEKGLKASEHYQKLLSLGLKYLSCGRDLTNVATGEADMDYNEDMPYIEASFMSDYGIDLENTKMHWWKFYNLMNGLSYSEFGNCCVLNRIRAIRNVDLKTITDKKERDKMAEAKEHVELKANKKENHLTKEQEESMENLNKLLGL